LITGGGRGIGLAAARIVGRHGASVALHDLDADRVSAAANMLRRENIRASSHVADATNEKDVERVVDEVLSAYERIDVLVNNVGGLTAPPKDLIDTTVAEFEATLELNLLSNVSFTRCVVPIMKQNGGGRIINLSSALAFRVVGPSHIGYDAAKGCVSGLTRVLALELAPHGILVNAVAPSSTLTEATIETGDDDPAYYNDYPLRRAALPDEIAGVIAFLASNWSSYCSGETFVVSGAQFIGSSQL
jgi:NAD(P)-dependent dehydrogenase (short-subunit alcohol dehydrogenase family)